MTLEIVTYGHPALRAKGRRIETVDAAVRKLAADMLETMAAAQGVGLAAQQVAMPVQLFVVDVSGASERPSRMWIGGKPVDPSTHMPMVLVNPEIETSGDPDTDVEGCLSFPGLLADIRRPARVRIRASDLEGAPVDFDAEGLLGRAVQHEFDHVQGILFIDRMSGADRTRLAGDIREILDGTAV